MNEHTPGQWDYDNASPDDDEHRKEVEDRKQAREDDKLEEAGL